MKKKSRPNTIPQALRFFTPSGEIATIWCILIAVGAYVAAFSGGYALYFAFSSGALRFAIPIGALAIGDPPTAFTAVQFVLLLFAAIPLAHLFTGRSLFSPRVSKRAAAEWGAGAALGASASAVCVALLLALDVSRLGWRLSAPRFTEHTLALAASCVLSAAGETVFFQGLVMGALRSRGRRIAGYAAAVAVAALAHGSARFPLTYLNWALCALACCLLYERTGRLSSAVGFRCAWALVASCLAGIPLTTGAVYEVYAASLYFVSGGDAGLMNGLLATVAFGAICAWLLRRIVALAKNETGRK